MINCLALLNRAVIYLLCCDRSSSACTKTSHELYYKEAILDFFTDEKIKQIKRETENDDELQKISYCIQYGWPAYKNINPIILVYYKNENEISEKNGLLYK